MALPAIMARFAAGLLARHFSRGGDRGQTPPPGIDIRVDMKGSFFQLDALNARHQRIIVMSLNRAAERARVQVRRELALVKGIPQKVLNRRVRVYKASRLKPDAAVWLGLKKRITAQELGGAIGTTAGGAVKVGRRTFRSAFPAKMPTGHRGIFTRTPNAKHKRRPDGQMSQLPIEEAIVQLMPEAEQISRDATRYHMKQTFPAELRRQVKRMIERGRL